MAPYELPAEEKMSADWGDRCPNFDPGCFCCQMWAMYDEVSRLKRENEHFTRSGIVEVAVRNQSVSEYMNHWEGRALAAERKVAELQSALAPQAGDNADAEPVERISRDRDIILEAINDYDEWMQDDDYDAQPVLDRIIARMKKRLSFASHPCTSTPAPDLEDKGGDGEP